MRGYLPPDYIDNQRATLAEVLERTIRGLGQRELDIASGYFNPLVWRYLRETLSQLESFRLLLGREPELEGAGLDRLDLKQYFRRKLQEDLEELPLDLDHVRLIKEEAVAQSLKEWFEGFWQEAEDYKQELIELLEASKFGGNLYSFFRKIAQGEAEIFELLEETTVRRSRYDIKKRIEAGERITLGGKEIRFPERRLESVEYDLVATYQGFYQDLARRIEALQLVSYNLEAFKRDGQKETIDRNNALIAIRCTREAERVMPPDFESEKLFPLLEKALAEGLDEFFVEHELSQETARPILERIKREDLKLVAYLVISA